MNIEELLVKFMKKAGEIALSYQDKIMEYDSHCKEETAASVVTEADVKISNLFKAFLKEELDHDDYVIIDEETLSSLGDDKYAKAKSKTYQFVIDPIDGTLPYSLGMPSYGTVVGIMKNMKPYMGAVYAPSLGELVVYGGDKVKRYKNPFTDKQKITELEEKDNNPVLIFPKPSSVQVDSFMFNKKKEVVVDFYAAAVHCIYLALGIAKGYYYSVWIWDVCGAWPILNKLGYKFYNIETGKELTEFGPENFSDGFKIKDFHVICKEKDYPRLKELARCRKK
ncbi:MAG: Inositol-1-monophosphatase [Alphaproteobacteria bacterium ADurb.Bin438]|nr:MAG: Inositol-1-monophosphatase [Alphaproteobacteria bacterium ADurb.Bin438]